MEEALEASVIDIEDVFFKSYAGGSIFTQKMRKYTDSIDERLTGRYKKCMEFCGDLRDKKILNIGSYNGWFEKIAVENGCMKIIGIDIDENNLLNAKSQVKDKNVKFLKASALDLSRFGTDYFDIVTMFDVIEHMPRNTEINCLIEVSRVLKNNGTLILSTPNNHFLAKILDPAWYLGHRHYSLTKLKELLSKKGFQIESVNYGGGFYELLSMILLYIFKWVFKMEIPGKRFFENKREREYLDKKGFVTLFLKTRK